MAVKNQAITIKFSVVDVSTGLGKTGDTANLTIKLVRDGVVAAPTNAPVEVDAINAPGTYKIALTASEMNCDAIRVTRKSSTANVQVIPRDIPIQSIDVNVAAIGGNEAIATSAGEYGFISANVEAIGGDTTAGENLGYAFANTDALPVPKDPGIITSFAGDFRDGERVPAIFAQFTVNGVPVQLVAPPTVSATLYSYEMSAENPLAPGTTEGIEVTHAFWNEGEFSSESNSYYVVGDLIGHRLIDGISTPIFKNRRGRILIRFHTDQANVDAKDVYREIGVNTGSFVQELIDPVLAAIEAKTKLLGTGTVTVQSPMVTATKFEIIRGDSYTNDTPFPNRPLWIRLTEVTFDLAALAAAPHGVRIHLKNGATEAVITPYSVVQDAEFSNAYTIAFGMTDEETRAMTAGTWEYELKAYYRHATSPDNYRVVTLAKSTFTVLEPVNDGAAGLG
jgi:hypothetical protein